MIPYILAAVGGYLISDSMKSDAKMADGGNIEMKKAQGNTKVTKSGKKIAYHDFSGELVKIGDKVEVQYNSGRNQGTPNRVIGVVTKIDDYGNWTLDNPIGELNSNPDYNKDGKTTIKPNNTYVYTDNLGTMHFKGFEESNGWEFWIKKLS